MTLAVITHPDCAGHDPVPGHPESPDRLRAVVAGLEHSGPVEVIHARSATRAELERVHEPAHIERIEKFRDTASTVAIDADTHAGPGSVHAAGLAAGAALMAAEAVLEQPGRRAFAAVRPPGHHAESGRAMGFCLYNNIAVAAAHALTRPGIARVAICDFDVHHGNGTEQIFANHAGVAFASSHQSPLYPGTGDPGTTLAPNVFNATLAPGTGSEAFRAVWSETLLPALDQFGPNLVLVSAGFDAHRRDPLAQLNLEAGDYHWIGQQLAALADHHATGRLAACLEGGYELEALAESARAFAEGMMG